MNCVHCLALLPMTAALLLTNVARAEEPAAEAPPLAAVAEPAPPETPCDPAEKDGNKPAERPDRGMGSVTEFDEGRPVIDRGTDDGLRVGSPVGLYKEVVRTIGSGQISEQQQLTIGKVVAVTTDAAIISVGVNQQIPQGTRAQGVARDDGKAFLAPPRLGGRGWFNADVRGLVSAADAGGGTYLAGSLGYRFKFPMAVELRATPVFMGLDNDIGVGKGSVVGLVMFDHPLFAIGLGGGVAINPGAVRPIFSQRLRVGAEDGLAFTFTSQISQNATADGYANWSVDLNEALFQIPLTTKGTPAWLVLRGLGGEFGGGGYVGARFRLHGNGEPGTWGLTPWLGGELYASGSTYLAGPGFGLGVETSF